MLIEDDKEDPRKHKHVVATATGPAPLTRQMMSDNRWQGPTKSVRGSRSPQPQEAGTEVGDRHGRAMHMSLLDGEAAFRR